MISVIAFSKFKICGEDDCDGGADEDEAAVVDSSFDCSSTTAGVFSFFDVKKSRVIFDSII